MKYNIVKQDGEIFLTFHERVYLIDDIQVEMLKNKYYNFDIKISKYHYYNYNNQNITILEELNNFRNKDIIIKFKNNKCYDIRSSNIIVHHYKYDEINTNIINYYYNNDGDMINKNSHKTILKLNKKLLIEVLRFAKKTYNEFLPLFWTGDEPPYIIKIRCIICY